MQIELIGVPFDGYCRHGHQARAAAALRDASLVAALAPHAVHDRGDLPLPSFQRTRGPVSGLLNEPALVSMTEQLNTAVAGAVAAGRFPIVFGADCSMLLGVVAGLREVVAHPGLVFLDGHEDTMPLDVVEDGEAANCEIGLLLGITGRSLAGSLGARFPALDSSALAILGQRDADWRRRFNVGSLADLGIWSQNLEQLRQGAGPEATSAAGAIGAAGAAAAAHVRQSAPRWWLHVDLDVLDPDVFVAQGLPDYSDEPGGLGWAELTALLEGAAGTGGCTGLSVTIYDPDQDSSGNDARNIVRLIAASAQARSATHT